MLIELIVAIRRKALEPYTFSNSNLSVPAGATVCVSAYNLMHNPDTYPEPDCFDPLRFSPKSLKDQQRRFIDVSETFPVWGYGSLAWLATQTCMCAMIRLSLANILYYSPGRFHASLVIKMVVSQLLLKYDLRLKDESARTRWSWETFAMPYESTQFILKELQ